MVHDARTVANEFIQHSLKSNTLLTPMQIQKLLFFSQGWMLGLHHAPLIKQDFEAWPYGPVLPVIYHNLSYYKNNPVTQTILAHEEDFSSDATEVIEQVFHKYGFVNGMRLSQITHVAGRRGRRLGENTNGLL